MLNNAIPVCRAYSADFKAEGKKISGLAAVYNSQTNIYNMFYEIIERGAFDGADLTDVLFFINHDTMKIPLARSRRNNGNSTMNLKIDDRGLNMDADVDIENNAESRALYSSVSRGDMTGMSFMFTVKEDLWENLDSDMPTRRILKIARVREVSAVNWPAYDSTEIDARNARSLDSDKNALESARAALDRVKNEAAVLKLRNQITSMKAR
ncbi:MAG: HK97 family phage prohead protease [Candidatus Dehalobacter alkaniphilus]